MISFIPMNEGHLEQVLRWRTQKDVSRYMFTDIDYNLENQYKWFESIKNSNGEKYWIIKCGDAEIGVISLNGIDLKNRLTSAGYYIGEAEYRRLGGVVLPYLYNYVFNEMKLNKIVAQIMEGNVNIIKLHALYGFRKVGILKQHVFKYDKYHDVIIFELLKENWLQANGRYKHYIADF